MLKAFHDHYTSYMAGTGIEPAILRFKVERSTNLTSRRLISVDRTVCSIVCRRYIQASNK